jgi:hypothetical protein
MTRSLSLIREALTELTDADLGAVNGAALAVPNTLNVRECFPHTAIDCLTRACE